MIVHTQCCGYREIADIYDYIPSVLSEDSHNRSLFGSLMLFDDIFHHVAQNLYRPLSGGFYLTSAGPRLGGNAIEHLKEVVAEHSLGLIFETPPVRNPNTGNTTQQFLWVVDWEGFFTLGFDLANRFPEYARSGTRAMQVNNGRAPKLSKTCGVFPEQKGVEAFKDCNAFSQRRVQDQFEWYKGFTKKQSKKTT